MFLDKSKMRKMKRLFVGFVIIILLMVLVLAVPDIDKEVEKALEKKGIDPTQANVSEVDLNNPPKEIIIENVEETNIVIYEVDYGVDKSVFMITSSDKFTPKDSVVYKDRQLLSFGFAGSSNESVFLKTTIGVASGLNKGYVMVREGSLTAMSTNLEIIEGKGKIRLIIYKNGESVEFGNSFIVSSAGVKKDYEIQSEKIITFEAGDVFSISLKSDNGIIWKDAITMIEIIT